MDLNTVRTWENALRKEIEDLKQSKEQVLSDQSIPKAVKDRFVDVLRSLKMTMIQVMSKCAQLRTESLPEKALKVRIEKIKFEYNEVKKNLAQLMQTAEPRSSKTSNSIDRSKSNDFGVPAAVNKDLDDICGIIKKAQENLEEHRHPDYEERIEVLEVENQELRRNLERIQNENSEVFEIISVLKRRLEKLEMTEEREEKSSNLPKRRVLLQPSSHAEELMKNNY